MTIDASQVEACPDGCPYAMLELVSVPRMAALCDVKEYGVACRHQAVCKMRGGADDGVQRPASQAGKA